MSSDVTLHLPDSTAERLKARAQQAGRTVDEVGALSIEEWLRQQEFPEIEFRAFGSERHACLKGASPIWQIILVAEGYGLNAEKTAAHFEWPLHRVQPAFGYYQVYPDDIDRAIEENRALGFKQLRRLLPRLESFSPPPPPRHR